MNRPTSILSLFALVLLGVIALSVTANAATKTWNGSSGTSWHTSGNWTGGLPSGVDTAVIPGGLGNYPNITSYVTVRGVTVKNGATLQLTSNTLDVGDVGFVVEGGGQFTQDGGAVAIEGSWSQGGIVNANGGVVRFTGNANIDVAGKAVVFSEDFGTSGTGWTFQSSHWSRAVPSSGGTGAPTSVWDGHALCLRNGGNYWGDENNLKMTGLYPNSFANNGKSPDRYAVSPQITRPVGVTNIDVQFRRWLAVDGSGDAQAQVIISKVDNPSISGFNTNWTPVFWESNVGYSANNDSFWKRTTINIENALSILGDPNSFYVIFNMGYVDNGSTRMAGLYVDDLRIIVPGELSSFYGLEIATQSNATVRFNSAMEVRGDLIVSPGARLDLGSFTHKIHGDFTNNSGTTIVNDSVVEFVGSGNSVIDGSGTAAAIEPSFLYEETFDSGNGGWTQINRIQGNDGSSRVWHYDASGGRAGSGGWRMDGWNNSGNNRCQKELISSSISIPANSVNMRLSYFHNFDIEQDYDHCFLLYSTNNGSSYTPVPFSAFLLSEYNGYVGQFTPSGLGTLTNAYKQQEAWTGNSGGWKRVLIDLDGLVTAPANIRFKWQYEQDRHANGTGIRVDEPRIIGASSTLTGNGLFEMVVRKDTPTLRVTTYGSLEVMNLLTIEEGTMIVANGPSGELTVLGNNTDSSTAAVVQDGGSLVVTSGNFVSKSTGNNVTRLRIESGGVAEVNGGIMRLGPTTSVNNSNNDTLELLSGGSLSVDGGTLEILNPHASQNFDLDLTDGMFSLVSGSVEVDGDVDIDSSTVFDMDGGTLEVEGDFTFENADFDSSDGRIRVQGDITLNNGTFSDSGATWESYGSGNSVININNALYSLGSFEANKNNGSEALLADPMVLLQDFSLLSGEFDHGVASNALNVAGDVSMTSGTTYTKRQATLTLDGSDQSITTTNHALWQLDVSNTGVATFNDGLKFCDELNVASGASALIKAGGTVHADTSVADAIELAGLLSFETNTTLRMEDGSDIEINSGGELRTAGTDPSAAATRVTMEGVSPGNDKFQINLNNGGSLNLHGAHVCDGTVHSQNAPAILAVTNTEFCRLPSGQGDAFVDISGVNDGFVSFRNVGFDRGSAVSATNARNIKANSTTTRVFVGGYYGDISGEAWDNDPANNVLWADLKAPLDVSGLPAGDYYTLADVLPHLPTGGGTVTIRSTWTDTVGGRQYVVPSFNMNFGRLRFPAFNGTINLDGFEFHGSDGGISIDLTNAGASATVNLFNCVVADPARVGGARAVVARGAGTINASFTTIDSSNTGTAGFSSATNSLFATTIAQNFFVDYGSRNLRLSSAAASSFNATRDASNPRDIDGKLRPTSTKAGAHHYHGEVAKTAHIIDINDDSNANTRRPAVIYNNGPSQNSAADVAYMTGSDGTNVYLSIISRTNADVIQSMSFSGMSASFTTFVQCEDNTDKYWLYTPYDSTGDGAYNKIRKVLHTKNGSSHSLTGASDITLLDDAGSALNFAGNGGWGGKLTVQNGHETTRFGEFQVSIALPASNGQVHVYFINANSSSGGFFNSPTFTTANRASKSFRSTGSFFINPNQGAVARLHGTKGNGHVTVVRYRDSSSNAVIVQLNRANGQVISSWNGSGGTGGSLATEPTILFASGGKGITAATDSPTITEFHVGNWATPRSVVVPGMTGFSAPSGVIPFGWFTIGAQMFPLYNESSGVGAIVAMEYSSTNNGGTTLEILGSSYSRNTHRYNAGGLGGFTNGVALVQGKPTAMVWSPIDKTLVCGTEAGLLYGWAANGLPGQDNTSARGAAHSGFPIRIPAGRVTDVSYVAINDAATQSALNMSGSGAAIAVFNDLGQMMLVRSPQG